MLGERKVMSLVLGRRPCGQRERWSLPNASRHPQQLGTTWGFEMACLDGNVLYSDFVGGWLFRRTIIMRQSTAVSAVRLEGHFVAGPQTEQ